MNQRRAPQQTRLHDLGIRPCAVRLYIQRLMADDYLYLLTIIALFRRCKVAQHRLNLTVDDNPVKLVHLAKEQ